MTERLQQLNREMRDLCYGIDSLQGRALLRVDDIENGLEFFDGEGLRDEMRERFKRLQRLITMI